jgi:flagellar hook-associated protein 2
MAGLSSPGIGSGLDINGLVTKLMEAEQAPLKALAKKEADYQAKLTAYGTLKGAFASFQTSAKGLSTANKFSTAKASAADATILAANASSIAKPGSYSIEVSKLAQSHKLASDTFDDPATSIGTGTLTIDFGTYTSVGNSFAVNADKTSKSITIDSTNNSLAGIRDAINEADAGVTASILNDGDGYRLVLSSNDSGKDNSLRVLVSGDAEGTNVDSLGLSQLAYDPTKTAGAGKNLEEKLAAQNAELTIDGIAISKSTNSIGDAITGVTLNLLKTTAADTPTTLTVSRDTTNVKTAVEGFVKAYNEMAATMKELGGYDFKTQEGGLLLGDTTLRSMQNQARNILTQRLEYADGGVSSLSDIGVSFQRDGTLSIDSSKLDGVLADPAKNVAGLFAIMGVPSDSLVSYGTSSSYTQPGRYGLNITRIATNGTATGSAALNDDATKTTITTDNNALTLNLNGTSATIALTAGTYTRDELVAELQSKINSDSSYKALGHKISVAHSAGILKLTSTLYGSSSSVVVTGGSAAATLFGSTSSVTGVDVAGEIGGIAGTGSGQILTGSGDASGLQLLIEGGNTGARGTVGFSRGIAWQLDQTLTNMLGTEGTLASRTEGIDRSIEDIESRRAVLNKRLVDIEKRYRAQFNALDQLVASMQQTSSYLTQQLANLPGSSSE